MPYRHVLFLFYLFLQNGLYAQVFYDTLPNLPEYYIQRVAKFNQEPEIRGAKVMLGNSITEGADWRKLLGDSAVLNRGISGDVTFGVLRRLDEVLRHKPSKLFLLIGINDLSRNTPEEIILKNIANIIKQIQAHSPSTQLFVQSILPINETFKNYPPLFSPKKQKHSNNQLTVGSFGGSDAL